LFFLSPLLTLYKVTHTHTHTYTHAHQGQTYIQKRWEENTFNG
jgi:hypothetical protein